MQLHLKTKSFEPTASFRETLERHIERLAPRLRHFAPDLVHLDATLEWHARKRDYTGSFRLSVAGELLTARLNRAGSADGLIAAAFDDLEEQLSRYMSNLRRERSHERKRVSPRSQDALEARERGLLEERELLDRGLNGDREAFDRLITEDLPEVQAAITEALREAGREPNPETIEHVLADVLTIALRRLPHKPARWSIPGWLTWLARREVRREVRGLAVAQSTEARGSRK